MTRNLVTLLFLSLCVLLSTSSFAQKEKKKSADNDAAYQNLKFNAQPKHQSEIGLSLGHFMVVGDILPRLGWGVGVHFRRAFDYAFAWRLDAQYGQAFGLEPRNSGQSHAPANRVLNGTDGANLNYASDGNWYHNYQLKYWSFTLQGVWSLNGSNFKQQMRKMNIYVLGGVGVNFFETFYDALDGDGNRYDFSRVADNLNPENSRDDRREVRDRLRDLLDGDYETRAETATGRRNGDEDAFQLNVHGNFGVGFAYKINERINIALEHQVSIIFGNEGDLLDGYRWRTVSDLTQYRDLVNYTNIRINYNIGKKDNPSEPLWWVSPLDLIAEDLSEVKARPILDLTDTDKDGVIDMLDEEKDSKEDCPVDTKGRILDSDGDNIPDCEDDEPHSPPGYKVDSKGVADVPPVDVLNEDDVNRIVDAKIQNYAATTKGIADWFLPMIHFNLDRYDIKGSEFGKLHHVATVMMNNPDVRVVASGHTDRTSGDCYNDLLSYNRANEAITFLVNKYSIPRDRFILTWGGESNTLVPTSNANLINRRVEFKIAGDSDAEKAKPDCGVSKAGQGGTCSGTKYSGNKEAGY